MVPEIILGSAIGTITARAVNNGMDALTQYSGNITWDSTPNHDEWGPDKWWSAADWIAWYQALVQKYGAEEAKRIWANEYDKSSYGAAEINYAVKNEEFKQFVKSTGLAEKSTILSKLFRAETSVDKALEPFGNLYKGVGDLITGTGNALGNTGEALDKGTDSIGNLLKWAPWIIGAALLVFAYFYFKPFAKVAS